MRHAVRPPATLLIRIDWTENMRRFYRIEASADLFGGVLLIREWGRIGSRGQRLSQWCANPAEAEIATAALLRAKLRRGYTPS
ncbi:WGR domain-containing protein [Paracoccus aurantiacus]|uniref:WGR domain-containing protein n=1 Tax=Paracoccus aurantiacus TaxID=2599412 RepID=UPI0036390372